LADDRTDLSEAPFRREGDAPSKPTCDRSRGRVTEARDEIRLQVPPAWCSDRAGEVATSTRGSPRAISAA